MKRSSVVVAGLATVLGIGCMGSLDPKGGDDDMTPDPGGGDPDPGTDPTGTPVKAILGSKVFLLAGYEGEAITGRGQLVRSMTGGDRVDIAISGLTPMLQYTAHIHNQPCSYGGGGHYKLDPAVVEVIETNEVWLRFTTDQNGIGLGSVTTTTAMRGDGLSLVVHDPATTPPAKMACVDFVGQPTEPVTAMGTFAPFAAAEAIDNTITGTGTLVRGMNETVVSISVTGLDPVSVYGAHVHNLPCSVTTGGGHYKLNPTIVEALETNELWPVIGNQPTGSVDATKSQALHVARSDAQSIVIHRIIEGAVTPPPKVACVDLLGAREFDFDLHGVAELMPDGISRGMEGFFGTATMVRELSGLTRILLAVDNAPASSSYKVHVHNLPCSLGGGGHYKIDTTVGDPVEDNEMWLNLTVDADGSAQHGMAWAHIARPDAVSLVLHDATDSAKVACIDLD